jgi:hypothetical protein
LGWFIGLLRDRESKIRRCVALGFAPSTLGNEVLRCFVWAQVAGQREARESSDLFELLWCWGLGLNLGLGLGLGLGPLSATFGTDV